MRFGPVPVAEAAGLISAHSVRRDDIILRKGAVIASDTAASLARAGLSEIVAAILQEVDGRRDGGELVRRIPIEQVARLARIERLEDRRRRDSDARIDQHRRQGRRLRRL